MVRTLLVLACGFAASFSSCKKEEAKQTVVQVTVVDGKRSALQNTTVYQLNSTVYNVHGMDPFFADQQSVTTSNGVATFQIDGIDFATGGQRSFYYCCKYSLGGKDKVKGAGITLTEGETKSIDLMLD